MRSSRAAARSIPTKLADGAAKRATSRVMNNVRVLREDQLLTKAELARKAGVSPLTVARIENGLDCRVDTKRKIILALGLRPEDKERVFGARFSIRKGR